MPNIRALRDVSLDDFAQHGHLLPEPLVRRCRHVVTETERVRQTVALLEEKRFDMIGKMLVASHRSLQHDYEVSCRELDVLVDAAIQQRGVFGARMTGGGFGGSIVCLVQISALDAVRAALSARFKEEFGQEPGFLVTKGGQGARVVF
jgi:galactokinase